MSSIASMVVLPAMLLPTSRIARVREAFKKQIEGAYIANPLLFYAIRKGKGYVLESIEMRWLNGIHLEIDDSETAWNRSYIPCFKRMRAA